MVLDDDTWKTVREAPGVLGFVGGDRKDPPTISDSEVRRILRKNTVLGDSRLATKKEIDFKFGDFVTILAGPFEGLEGEVAEINEEKMTVKVSVLVFGRSTPTEVPVDYVTLKNE
jgi:transcriptional antiterminator NusG